MTRTLKNLGRAVGLVAIVGFGGSALAAPPAAADNRAAPRVNAETVNINSADAETIADVLVGIGPAKAEAIVAHRKTHGAFKSLEQLGDVQGIAPRTIERNRGRITLR